jgi:hypothetical protein
MGGISYNVWLCGLCVVSYGTTTLQHLGNVWYTTHSICISGNSEAVLFLGERRGTRTAKHFVNITGKSKNFKMSEFPLNQLQTYYGYLSDLCPLTAFIFSDLNYKMVIFLSQTEEYP